MKKEEPIHNAICQYIRTQYPNVIFTSDSSGVRLNIGAAKGLKAKRSNHKIPDLIIMQPNQIWHGLMLEIKTSDTKILTKKGTYTSPHIKEQAKTLEMLNDLKYLALFVCGFDEAKKIIDSYMLYTTSKLNIGLSFNGKLHENDEPAMTC